MVKCKIIVFWFCLAILLSKEVRIHYLNCSDINIIIVVYNAFYMYYKDNKCIYLKYLRKT